jgi:hypothetical protein
VNEYLTFRRMITPVFIQVIFWIAVVFIVIGGLVALADGQAGGILIILLGPLAARIYAEILIVIFRINDNVAAIRHRGDATAVPPAELH